MDTSRGTATTGGDTSVGGVRDPKTIVKDFYTNNDVKDKNVMFNRVEYSRYNKAFNFFNKMKDYKNIIDNPSKLEVWGIASIPTSMPITVVNINDTVETLMLTVVEIRLLYDYLKMPVPVDVLKHFN